MSDVSARVVTDRQTHTHTPNDYSNPCCTFVPRVNNHCFIAKAIDIPQKKIPRRYTYNETVPINTHGV
jgi:hypothetical protein